MKSFAAAEGALFRTLQTRLIRFVMNRISNGDFSERGLARMLRVSQPQIHNVLKGARKLTPELADRILLCFGMSTLDLMDSSELNAHLCQRADALKLASRSQTGIAAHVEIQRFTTDTPTPKKPPQKQSFVDTDENSKSA